MAPIRRFEKAKDRERYSAHDEVEAHYINFKLPDGRKFLQIDTYGRSPRALPGKLSQSIQLDKEGAEALFKILKQEFHFE